MRRDRRTTGAVDPGHCDDQGFDGQQLQFGVHVLYSYATDGQDANSVSTGEHSDPLVGNIAAYVFLVY